MQAAKTMTAAMRTMARGPSGHQFTYTTTYWVPYGW